MAAVGSVVGVWVGQVLVVKGSLSGLLVQVLAGFVYLVLCLFVVPRV